jgi:hypothetical protein
MANTDFIPSRDEDFNAFALNMSTLITAAPTSWGLVAGDATALAALYGTFNTALAVTKVPSTRTPTAVIAKNTARAQLTSDIRALAKRIQATLSVTAAQKISLGITVPDHTRTPAPVPATRPILSIANITSRTLKIRLSDEATPTKRAKPPGVDGAQVYSFIGATPPGDLSAWTFKGLARKGEFNVPYNLADVGQVAHLRAVWINTRGASGPVSDEITGSIAA